MQINPPACVLKRSQAARRLSWYGLGLASADRLPVVDRIPAGPLGSLKCDPPKGNGRRPKKIVCSKGRGPSVKQPNTKTTQSQKGPGKVQKQHFTLRKLRVPQPGARIFFFLWCSRCCLFFSVLRLCGSRQVVAHCRADERIVQMQLLCPALGSQKWSKDYYAVQSRVRPKRKQKQTATKQKPHKNTKNKNQPKTKQERKP